MFHDGQCPLQETLAQSTTLPDPDDLWLPWQPPPSPSSSPVTVASEVPVPGPLHVLFPFLMLQPRPAEPDHPAFLGQLKCHLVGLASCSLRSKSILQCGLSLPYVARILNDLTQFFVGAAPGVGVSSEGAEPWGLCPGQDQGHLLDEQREEHSSSPLCS